MNNCTKNICFLQKFLTVIISIIVTTILLSAQQKRKETPEIQALLSQKLRDPSICTGPDGTYYLTGTTANNPAGNRDTTGWWHKNEGIRIWQSKDFKNWEPLGLVWSLDKDATWASEFIKQNGVMRRALWAPEMFYLKGTFWLTYSMNYRGCGLLKSTSGKPEGPYVDVKQDGPLTGNIDASLFQDDDGSVYWVYQNGMIAKMKDDMSGLAEEPRHLKPSNHKHVGFEGAFITKNKGKYILICAEFNGEGIDRTYDCMAANADNLYGPYGDRYLAIPSGGHNMIFRDKKGKWMSTIFGSDNKCILLETPGILPIKFDKDVKFHPLMQTQK
jgi:xylan 1,4-beta-xylosidase